MHVVVTDRKYPHRGDLYGDLVEQYGGEITYGDCTTEEQVTEECEGADAIILFKSPITRTVAERLDEAELMIRIGAGFDNINVRAATDHGIAVSNVPGLYCGEELAEHALALMLAAARDLVHCDREMRTSEGWGDRSYVVPMREKTFGVVGLGHIGRMAARQASAFGMDVIAHDPYLSRDIFTDLGVKRVGFDDLLTQSDCVSIHCPLNSETHHMFSTTEFECMSEDTVLVNTARGPIVDEQALVEAVKGREIYAAGLDVFENEPPDQTLHSRAIESSVPLITAGVAKRLRTGVYSLFVTNSNAS